MRDDHPDPLQRQWYLLGDPWASSDNAGMTVLAGSPDPHVATIVCDCQDILGDQLSDDEARAVAAHIASVHNAHQHALELADWAAAELDALQRSCENPATGEVTDRDVAAEIERVRGLIESITGVGVCLGRNAETQHPNRTPRAAGGASSGAGCGRTPGNHYG